MYKCFRVKPQNGIVIFTPLYRIPITYHSPTLQLYNSKHKDFTMSALNTNQQYNNDDLDKQTAIMEIAKQNANEKRLAKDNAFSALSLAQQVYDDANRDEELALQNVENENAKMDTMREFQELLHKQSNIRALQANMDAEFKAFDERQKVENLTEVGMEVGNPRSTSPPGGLTRRVKLRNRD